MADDDTYHANFGVEWLQRYLPHYFAPQARRHAPTSRISGYRLPVDALQDCDTT